MERNLLVVLRVQALSRFFRPFGEGSRVIDRSSASCGVCRNRMVLKQGNSSGGVGEVQVGVLVQGCELCCSISLPSPCARIYPLNSGVSCIVELVQNRTGSLLAASRPNNTSAPSVSFRCVVPHHSLAAVTVLLDPILSKCTKLCGCR